MKTTFTIYGRSFEIAAEFQQGEEGTRQANAFMEQNRDTGLLYEGDGRLIIAFLADKGTPVPSR